MNPKFLRDLVRAYTEAQSKLEAVEALINLEYHLLTHFLEDYRKKHGHEAPKNYEDKIDLRAAAETAILLCGGEIWHED